MDSNTVLSIFREITTIPRESGHEEKMTAYLLDFAAKHNLEAKRDTIGNVLIVRQASKGKENVPAIVLQAHQDMVCEKSSGCDHDFATDPIKYEIEDGWMIAKETTLGADDGIGIAAGLALLTSDLEMGKVECLFTISEETGMDGAMALEEGFFTGKTLINLDSEDEGQLFVGCAGGMDSTATFTYKAEDIKDDYKTVKLKVGNVLGGHSGDDINKMRINAVQQLARFLYTEKGKGYQLVSFEGGNKYNAIAREAEAVIALPETEIDAIVGRFDAFGKALAAEYSVSDPDVKCTAEVCTDPDKKTWSIRIPFVEFTAEICKNTTEAICDEVASRFISALTAVHHGVLAMSQDIPDLVETSSNLAFVRMPEKGKIVVGTSQRSSVDTAIAQMADKVQACFNLAGATVERTSPYPGWKPDMNSHILKVAVESYRKLFGTEPLVKAIHAGLECGLFLEKFPGLDMISFGPTLRGVHAPGEKLNLASNEKFVQLLVDIVTNFK